MPPERLRNLVKFWNCLWEAVPFTGNLWSGVVVAASGRVDGSALLEAIIYSDGARQKAASILQSLCIEGASPKDVQFPVVVVALYLISHIEQSFTIGEGRKMLSPQLPSDAWSKYPYRRGKRFTHSDPRADLAKNVIAPSKAIKAKPLHVHAKHNILYLAKNSKVVATGMERFRTLNIVLDEGRFPNCQVLQGFASAPIGEQVAAGACLPSQIMPAISISLREKKVNVRIANALGKHLLRKGAAPKPKSDPGMPTWHSIVALDNSLKSWLPEGLQRWQAVAAPIRLQKGCGGRYELEQGRWRVIYNTADGEEIRRWLLPGGPPD